ncbi:NADH dehydrogenase [ubiquinone] 1 beta subcomplex subunit 6 [Ischnura elegans]|uniref:NADH dehydrogenase [ubiquinone] 1 beta subcomplex subunit 6 n=1 Tax=Ischnura elegans TaxID=197161 RepID=UPI001ED86FE9|nr:NADH dehydrogenase [ubiquinone] 1 beta subcomplex subunit 6 [Ischnura elegans]
MASPTGGVRPFPIEGRVGRERERLMGMTDEERAWRKQWLKDQELTPREPLYQSEDHPDLINPIRRVYRFPLDKAFGALAPVLGKERAMKTRWWTGKILLGLFSVYATAYYFKYNQNDWTRRGGWRVISARPSVYPGDPTFPAKSERSVPSDYADRKFKTSVI